MRPGVIAIPLNTRLSAKEIDNVLTDANPRGLIRQSFPRPTAQVSWQLVLDQEALDLSDHACAAPIYDRNAVLTLIYHDFYPGARREMLHETNRRDVITNLLVWISEILENRS